LEQARVTVLRDFQDEEPYIVADIPQLKQLFLNLLLNALEAIGREGEVTVRISRKRLQSDTWIIVEVADTGPGIPEAIRANIFNPFFTTKARGSGLGSLSAEELLTRTEGRLGPKSGTTGVGR
jgi:signal transduction histidine kinase